VNYYEEIRTELINNEIYKKVKDYSKNKNDLKTYYNVGKLIVEAQGGEARSKYGDGLIKEYSKKLQMEVGKMYNSRTLRRIRQFYLLFENWSTVSTKITWSHYSELLSLKDINIINYYIKITEEENLSVRELRNKIKNKEYERLSEETKSKLIKQEENNIIDFVKNPIMIKNNNFEIVTEKILQKLILEDISSFLKELGIGFTFIDSEYKIKIGNNYNYIDLLLFNIKYNCYVVVELKVTVLKKEHIGQIQVYMNYIDKNLKDIHHNKTIGIIIVKKDNKFILEYSSDKRIFETTYMIIDK